MIPPLHSTDTTAKVQAVREGALNLLKRAKVMKPLTVEQIRLWKIAAGIVVVGSGLKVCDTFNIVPGTHCDSHSMLPSILYVSMLNLVAKS